MARDDDGTGSWSEGSPDTGDGDDSTGDGTRRRLLALAGLSLVPWTVQVLPGELFFVFPWGLASTRSLDVVLLDSYLLERTAGPAGLPRRLLAWPIATVVYACALAAVSYGSLEVGRAGPDDSDSARPVVGRLAGAGEWLGIDAYGLAAVLFAGAGLVHLQVTLGLLALGAVAVPTGPLLSFLAALWVAGWSRPTD